MLLEAKKSTKPQTECQRARDNALNKLEMMKNVRCSRLKIEF